ncbi:MAG: TonB-dependent receptor plug domain-containing protein, partial [Rhodospirillaceae bacterium]
MRHNLRLTTCIFATAFLIPATVKSQPVEIASAVEEISVIGKQDSYFNEDVKTGTKTNSNIFDIPLSISVINDIFLRDLRAETLSDAYPYTVGLSQSGINANSFSLRGLPADLQNVQVDNLPGLASRFGSPTTANVERIEILKGPASVLYGQVEPGGLINIVSKRPEAETAIDVYATFQSYAGRTTGFGDDLGATLTVDATGPLSEDGKWLYRLIGSAENISSFREGVDYKNYYVFPSVTYLADGGATITVGAELLKEDGAADDGLVAVNNDITLTAPINVRYQEPEDEDNDEGIVLFADLSFPLST